MLCTYSLSDSSIMSIPYYQLTAAAPQDVLMYSRFLSRVHLLVVLYLEDKLLVRVRLCLQHRNIIHN